MNCNAQGLIALSSKDMTTLLDGLLRTVASQAISDGRSLKEFISEISIAATKIYESCAGSDPELFVVIRGVHQEEDLDQCNIVEDETKEDKTWH